MDERTFARAVEAYTRRLYAVAYRLLGNRADAEDAVQRALLKAFEARESYAPQWAVSTWLYRVLTNVCIDELRRRRRTPPEPLPRARPGLSGGGPRPDARAGDRAPRGARAAGAPLRERPRLPGARNDQRNFRQHGQEPARTGQGNPEASAGGIET